MTVLQKYQRLEAAGLWRATPQEQRRDVIVSIGDASLTITDLQERVLGHWSLPAVRRANPGKVPAIYHPDGDTGETLEIDSDGVEMIDAIEEVRSAISKSRPKPGRLRLATLAMSALSVAALAVFWLPEALQSHTLKVVPEAKRAEIGAQLLDEMVRLGGAPCDGVVANPALSRLARRLGVTQLIVLPDGIRESASLPGGILLVNRSAVEDFDEPDATAGFVIAEKTRAAMRPPLEALLETGGVMSSVRLLTTGTLAQPVLRAHAETLSLQAPTRPSNGILLQAFARAQINPRAYALALDATGETTLELVEAGDVLSGFAPVMPDSDWVALQGICSR